MAENKDNKNKKVSEDKNKENLEKKEKNEVEKDKDKGKKTSEENKKGFEKKDKVNGNFKKNENKSKKEKSEIDKEKIKEKDGKSEEGSEIDKEKIKEKDGKSEEGSEIDKEKIKEKDDKSEQENEKSKPVETEPETKTPGDYDKILRNFLILIGGVMVFIILVYVLMGMSKAFEYKGVEFNEHEEKNLLFYKTKFPVYDSQGEKRNSYALYLRKHPNKETGKIDFDGDFESKKNMVINFTQGYNEIVCEGEKKGDESIALTNFVRFFQKTGTKVIKDDNATCDPEERYIFVNFKTGDKTRIEETNESCYDVYIKDCEVLEGTERFILEALVELEKKEESKTSS